MTVIIKSAVLIMLALYFTACAQSAVQDTGKVKRIIQEYYPATAELKARIFLVPGYNSGSGQFMDMPWQPWVKDLQARGYEVIAFTLPTPQLHKFSADGGQRWRDDYAAQLLEETTKADARYGPAPKQFIAGGSFGGLHAMMAVVIHPDLFDGYLATVPVTDYTAFAELSAGNSSNFNPFNEIAALALKPGFLQWGNRDEIVNFRLTIDLADQLDAAGADITAIELDGVNHDHTPEALANMTIWLESQQ